MRMFPAPPQVVGVVERLRTVRPFRTSMQQAGAFIASVAPGETVVVPLSSIPPPDHEKLPLIVMFPGPPMIPPDSLTVVGVTFWAKLPVPFETLRFVSDVLALLKLTVPPPT